MYGSMADIQSAAAEIRQGKKIKKKQKNKPQHENIMVCPIPIRRPQKGSKGIYIAPFILCILAKRSDMDHTVLPANYTMPDFPS